jgi:hypothetical protein
MKLFKILDRATDFGTFRSRDNFFSFTLKILIYIFPAIIIGHYTDMTVQNMKTSRVLGDNEVMYIILQTLFIIVTMYTFVTVLSDYMSEFQMTLAGGYFTALYFGIQTNYISILKDYMTSLV